MIKSTIVALTLIAAAATFWITVVADPTKAVTLAAANSSSSIGAPISENSPVAEAVGAY